LNCAGCLGLVSILWVQRRGGKRVNEPRAEYERRLKGHERALAACEARHVWVGNAKLAVIAVGLVLVWLVWARACGGCLLVACAGGLRRARVVHELILRKRRAEETAVALYRRGIGRIEDRWAGSGTARRVSGKGSCVCR